MIEEKLLNLHCTSILAPCIIDFVEQKRALGNKYNADVEAFNEFDRFCNDKGLTHPSISKEFRSKSQIWDSLRHSKAMHLVEAEKNLIYIRDFLGHESIETTQVYAKANPEARRKALETMDKKMNTPAMPDWNDDPDLKAFLKGL